MENTYLNLYLELFFMAWKKAYKMSWIFYKMEEAIGKAGFDAFLVESKEKQYPLVPFDGNGFASSTYFIVAVNKSFSDWMYSKNPDLAKFTANVLKNSAKLQYSDEVVKSMNKNSQKDISERKWEALDSFGGKVKTLQMRTLRYHTNGRSTGVAFSGKI